MGIENNTHWIVASLIHPAFLACLAALLGIAGTYLGIKWNLKRQDDLKRIDIRKTMSALITDRIQNIWNLHYAIRALKAASDGDRKIEHEKKAEVYRNELKRLTSESNALIEEIRTYFKHQPKLLEYYLEIGEVLDHIARDVDHLTEPQINQRLKKAKGSQEKIQRMFPGIGIVTGSESGVTKTPSIVLENEASPSVNILDQE